MKQVIEGLEEGLQAIATALEGDGYPKPTSATDGQVLTADGQGGADWEDAPSGLPSTQFTQTGDVLTVNDNGDPAWITPSGGLPAQSYSTANKVLTSVYDDKSGESTAEWQTSGSLPSQDSSTANKVLVSVYDDKSGESQAEWRTMSAYNTSRQRLTHQLWVSDNSGYYYYNDTNDDISIPDLYEITTIAIYEGGAYYIVPELRNDGNGNIRMFITQAQYNAIDNLMVEESYLLTRWSA